MFVGGADRMDGSLALCPVQGCIARGWHIFASGMANYKSTPTHCSSTKLDLSSSLTTHIQKRGLLSR